MVVKVLTRAHNRGSAGQGMNWVQQARCRDEDPELFFPIGSTGPAAVQVEAAKAVCMTCPVRLDCLEWALATAQDSGVWGGLSEEERRALRRARRREATIAVAG
jgi:WhiB family redox-sensing transcriptional regulator